MNIASVAHSLFLYLFLAGATNPNSVENYEIFFYNQTIFLQLVECIINLYLVYCIVSLYKMARERISSQVSTQTQSSSNNTEQV